MNWNWLWRIIGTSFELLDEAETDVRIVQAILGSEYKGYSLREQWLGGNRPVVDDIRRYRKLSESVQFRRHRFRRDQCVRVRITPSQALPATAPKIARTLRGTAGHSAPQHVSRCQEVSGCAPNDRTGLPCRAGIGP
jgi:hypothetical protein